MKLRTPVHLLLLLLMFSHTFTTCYLAGLFITDYIYHLFHSVFHHIHYLFAEPVHLYNYHCIRCVEDARESSRQLHHYFLAPLLLLIYFVKCFSGVAELTTQLLRLIGILWLPLCRINKLGNTYPRRLSRSLTVEGYQPVTFSLDDHLVFDL